MRYITTLKERDGHGLMYCGETRNVNDAKLNLYLENKIRIKHVRIVIICF